jgi:hypothetical protein
VEKLRSDLAAAEERVVHVMHTNKGMEATILSNEKHFKAELAAQKEEMDIRLKTTVFQEQRVAMTKIVDLRRELEAKAAEAQRDFGRKMSEGREEAMREADVAEKMHQKEKLQWCVAMEQMQDAKDDLEEELLMQRARGAKLAAQACKADDAMVSTTIPRSDHEIRLASERQRLDHETQCRAEAERLLEVERAKVLALEQTLADGLETVSKGMVAASKAQTAAAEKLAKQQTKRADKAEKEAKAAKDEMKRRVDGAMFITAEYHKEWAQFEHAKLFWEGKVNGHSREATDAKNKVGDAQAAVKRVQEELAEARRLLVASPTVSAELAKQVEEMYVTVDAEVNRRAALESKLEQVANVWLLCGLFG